MKIKKWAEEKGYPITESDYFDSVTVDVNGKKYTVENRKSSIYRSGKTGTLKGNAKGIYFKEGDGYAIRVYSQQEAIERIKQSLLR